MVCTKNKPTLVVGWNTPCISGWDFPTDCKSITIPMKSNAHADKNKFLSPMQTKL